MYNSDFEDAFNLFSKDGKINRSDLKDIMKVLEGNPPKEEDINAMIEVVDSDGLYDRKSNLRTYAALALVATRSSPYPPHTSSVLRQQPLELLSSMQRYLLLPFFYVEVFNAAISGTMLNSDIQL